LFIALIRVNLSLMLHTVVLTQHILQLRLEPIIICLIVHMCLLLIQYQERIPPKIPIIYTKQMYIEEKGNCN